ncbi:uncharacterized protein [Macrobrachium rosenbergii]|uniref:uncharacterized protein n=1 Tax=Macrobrachium rosenbergii TaxID=79674 RepID=UPI0034D43068
MLRRKKVELLTLFVGLQLVSSFVEGKTVNGDHGLSRFRDLLRNDTDRFCKYIICQENETPGRCPEGTYVDGVAQFGCCGACVIFKQYGEDCTGSIDPKYGMGYHGNDEESLRAQLTGSGQISDSLPPNQNVLSSSWCDFGLQCRMGITLKTVCFPGGDDDKGCRYVQKQYQDFLADPEPDPEGNPQSEKFIPFRDDYRWSPTCSEDGYFAEKQCKGPSNEGRCVCVDPVGNRIFGSAFDFQKDLYETMNCKCSRKVWERYQAGESTVTLHCAQNGNYEPLQCEDGWCYCIDPVTAKTYGPNLPESALKLLPCYDAKLLGQQYLRRCESEFHAHAHLSDLLKAKGVQPPSISLSCDPDGSYSPVQYDGPDAKCYDRYYQWLWSPAGDGCQCRRDNMMFKDLGIQVNVNCEVNSGMYEQIQTRGNTVYCADQDGVRTGPLVYKQYEAYLSCKEAQMCQAGTNRNCRLACEHCTREFYDS